MHAPHMHDYVCMQRGLDAQAQSCRALRPQITSLGKSSRLYYLSQSLMVLSLEPEKKRSPSCWWATRHVMMSSCSQYVTC